MTREQKIARARGLRAKGETYAEIGKRLGVAKTTARRWLDAEAAEQDRAWSRAYKAKNREAVRAWDREYARQQRIECPRCGGLMKPGSKLCGPCRHDDRDARCRQVVSWWAEGKPLSDIRRTLGWSMEHLATEMHRMREEGYDLPYRYKLSSPRFPELVAA